MAQDAHKTGSAAGSSEERSVVASGTIFRGAIESECPVTVAGLVEGELNAPSLLVAESGGVHGKIKVKSLASRGTIGGEIDAQSVSLGGNVSDNTTIRASDLEVKLATSSNRIEVTFGSCELQVGSLPAAAADLMPGKTAKIAIPMDPAVDDREIEELFGEGSLKG
ncbi:MAG: polymer-forming cytoskeletal protein [Candidatus Schekmanbacteria bacterium]|nr:polymer-forming cytoskeletal protein [Candidatus Schekmanbacteria bacterium]